jgi:hypothetical protein
MPGHDDWTVLPAGQAARAQTLAAPPELRAVPKH